jgi:hypothetical protein
MTFLDLQIMTSANVKEFANDAGEGKGGRWTNHFFAKGRLPCYKDYGKVIKGVGSPGEDPPTQETCTFDLVVKQK